MRKDSCLLSCIAFLCTIFSRIGISVIICILFPVCDCIFYVLLPLPFCIKLNCRIYRFAKVKCISRTVFVFIPSFKGVAGSGRFFRCCNSCTLCCMYSIYCCPAFGIKLYPDCILYDRYQFHILFSKRHLITGYQCTIRIFPACNSLCVACIKGYVICCNFVCFLTGLNLNNTCLCFILVEKDIIFIIKLCQDINRSI